jgi:uncharacterized membrane protein YdjX (TVP38/TMEM64 family)
VIHRNGVDQGPARGPLTRYFLLIGGALTLFLVIFLVAEAFSVAVLDDPTPWLARGDAFDGLIGTALLIADVVLPVPSSVIMISYGALFGVVGGASLSLVGSLGAAMAGYAIGRCAGPPLLRSVCSEAEHARADRFVRRWGALAIAASRPVPLLAETVAIAAGASSLGVARTLVSAAAGSVPGAVLYAVAGAARVGAPSGLLMFGLVLAVATVLWLVGRRIEGVEP